MVLRLYNSLTRAVQPFEPLESGHVRMYTCGPTVYDRAHVGNFRAFAWEDLLRRYLKWKGYRVTQVMNLTDVDDRTINAARVQGLSLDEVTRPVSEWFFEDWETLGLEPVEHNPRATDHVPHMIELVQRLEEGGYTYERDGSVYFAISRFTGYGRLIDLDLSRASLSERVEGDEDYSKDDPRDFVLWKGGVRADEGEVAVWDSPWGRGRPGWHLECSAMAMEYLGPTLDIHTGGVDNIFPHHVNEMAQSEAATGVPFSRFWLHAAHLLVDDAKMSKSLGNYHTVASLVAEGHRPSSIRYLLLSAHYRTQLNFTLEGLRTAGRTVERLYGFRRRLREIVSDAAPEHRDRPPPPDSDVDTRLGSLADTWRGGFVAAMDDDLNVSDALGATFTLVRDANALLDEAGERATVAGVVPVLAAVEDFERVFGVLALRDREESGVSDELRAWIEARVADRTEARRSRDFARADSIREELAACGVLVEDTPSGTRWTVTGAGG